jgi:AhpC/TSA family
MYPDERSLVRKFSPSDFAIVGVDSDPHYRLKQILANKTVLWPCFWDQQPSGPIARAWGIRGYPTLFLLDQKGVIRDKDLSGPELEAAVAKLVLQLKHSRKK